jgi:hypothetical protein
VATVLYTALVPLRVYSVIDDWYASPGDCLPLDPKRASTVALLAAGKIELAPDGSSDTTTPAHTLRGQPGAHVGVSN